MPHLEVVHSMHLQREKQGSPFFLKMSMMSTSVMSTSMRGDGLSFTR